MTNDRQANEPLPILYSFRRCPYAMRARLAIAYSDVPVELREVVLSNKPKSMLVYSSKGTVPVLVLPDKTVIDESRDIIYWALSISDPEQWWPVDAVMMDVAEQLMDENDFSFKQSLDKYKYHVRYPECPAADYRAQGEAFLAKLNSRLFATKYLLSDKISIADIAIFPFVRQFAHVDKEWFYQTTFTQLQIWLDAFLQSELFKDVMQKHSPWKDDGDD
jgi:glutathione S-transferase